jgi:hypothetical protein
MSFEKEAQKISDDHDSGYISDDEYYQQMRVLGEESKEHAQENGEYYE